MTTSEESANQTDTTYAPPNKLQELMQDWFYARRYLLDTFDPYLIERHAEGLLARALNIGRVICFAGSGLSMSYGRISWGDLVYVQQQAVFDEYNKFYENFKKRHKKKWGSTRSAKKQFQEEYPQIQSLHQTLKSLQVATREPTESVKADRYPMVFQLCDQLSRAIEANKPKSDGAATADNLFHKTAKRLSYDDLGHARRIIQNALDGSSDKLIDSIFRDFKEDVTRDLASRSRSSTSRHRFRDLFTAHSVSRLCSMAAAGRKRERNLSDLIAAAAQMTDNRSHLLPIHRFIVGALLRLLSGPARRNFLKSFSRRHRAKSRGVANRADLLPPHRDPLTILTDRLRITRFLTTNYDLEIEQMMHDKGFDIIPRDPPPEGTPSPRRERTDNVDPLGNRFRDLVFHNENAADLFDFATRDRPNPTQLVHLHGRSTDDDQMVVTESDYQRLYLRDDDRRELVDEAISLTFAANPVLFVGLGMGEDDILRPLRHFMGQSTRLGDRVGVAILPDLDGSSVELEEKTLLLGRYGIYATHYGAVQLDKGNPRLVRWLSVINKLINRIENCFKALEQKREKALEQKREFQKAYQELIDYIGKHSDIRDHSGAVHRYFKKESTDGRTRYRLLTPWSIDGIPCGSGGSLDIAHEVALVNCCIAAVEALHKRTPRGRARPEFVRLAQVHRDIAKGVFNALMSTFLCARLSSLRQKWNDWKDAWFNIPIAREVIDNVTDPMPNPPGSIRIVERNAIELAPNPVDQTRGRFYAGAPSQTYFTLFDALESAPKTKGISWRDYHGRRLFVLLDRRGAGKGHFFAAFKSPQRLGEFLKSSWAGTDPPKYFAAAFFGLSFSHEVISVFDRISNFLQASFAEIFPTSSDQKDNFEKSCKDLGDRRIDRLQYVLRQYHESATKREPHGRVLVAVSGIGRLFSADGKAKNAQIGRAFAAIVSNAASAAPIDFIVLVEEHAVPRQFRNALSSERGADSGTIDLIQLTRADLSEKGRRDLEGLLGRASIEPVDVADFRRHDKHPRPLSIVHVLREVRAILLPMTFFPRVTLAIALDHALKQLPQGEQAGGRANIDRTESLFTEHAEHEVRGAHGERYKKGEYRKAVAHIIPRYLTTASQKILAGEANDDVGAALDKLLGEIHGDSKEVGNKDRDREAERLDRVFKDIHRKLARNRYAYTLILAAADELIGNVGDQPGQTNSEAIDRVAKIIGDVQRAVSATHSGVVQNVVLDIVLTTYAERHALSKPLPARWERKHRIHSKLQKGPPLWALLSTLLWHLSVIGQSVEADVLAQCPKVVAAVRAVRRFSAAGPNDTVKIVRAALDLLVHRCLAFRIAPYPYRDRPDPEAFRFAVHGLVQRHVFRKLNAPFVDTSEVDQFTISIYASQPNDLPRPTAQAHRDIRALVAALSRYFELPNRLPSFEPALPAEQRARMLRAAYGVMRSIYWVAIVARFDGYDDGTGVLAPEDGYFEDHRLQVRWLILMARAVGHELEAVSGAPRPPSDRPIKEAIHPRAPFYAEEIVWLYNECGVLGLIQGKLNDAVAMFDCAFSAARRIEPKETGALWARIALNRAIVDIERGNTRPARAALQRIESIGDEDEGMHWVAHGYLGLIQHLAGNLPVAVQQYTDAIDHLTELGHSRAASIMSRHLGDLYRLRGAPFFEEAEKSLRDAVNLAALGGHEDIRHLARVSRVRLLIARESNTNADEIQRELDAVSQYARIIGMPRLTGEVCHVRAALLLKLGETRLAGTMAKRAVEIATAHDLRLRKIGAMLLLARIYIGRGQADACRPILTRVIELAHNADYNIALESAESMLNTASLRRI